MGFGGNDQRGKVPPCITAGVPTGSRTGSHGTHLRLLACVAAVSFLCREPSFASFSTLWARSVKAQLTLQGRELNSASTRGRGYIYGFFGELPLVPCDNVSCKFMDVDFWML